MTPKQKKLRRSRHNHHPEKPFQIPLTKIEIDSLISWLYELKPTILRISDEDEGEGAAMNERVLTGILGKLEKTDKPD